MVSRYTSPTYPVTRLGRVFALVAFLLTGCSPGYLFRAGWEEAGILWRKQPIEQVLSQEGIDEDVKRKLSLVLQAKEFSKSFGLTPDGSYSEYSSVDRDVLVYVLTAAPRTKLTPYTWWFPVVGSVPYKGYFELDDAKREAKRLEERGYDVSVRGSAAFSTLGWFDDPLLSTVLRSDDIAVVDTVLHEILHQTIWISDHVPFNESLANFVGSRASAAFFRTQFGEGDPRVVEAERRWQDELRFATLLAGLVRELDLLFREELPEGEILRKKREIIERASEQWRAEAATASSDAYTKVVPSLNNASILGLKTYLTEPELFQRLFDKVGGDLARFVEELRELKARSQEHDPYDSLRKRIDELQ